jgi:hypothetical protein
MTERPQKITVLGVLLIATLTIQTATAAARNARKSARALVQVTQQLRERDGFSASAAVEAVIDFGATTTGHLFLRRANNCHSTAISADQWPDDVRLSDIEDRFICSACGKRGADVRPDFAWDKRPPASRRWDRDRCVAYRCPSVRRMAPEIIFDDRFSYFRFVLHGVHQKLEQLQLRGVGVLFHQGLEQFARIWIRGCHAISAFLVWPNIGCCSPIS